MANVRLMDTAADYARLGVNPDTVEVWEDRRRTNPADSTEWEWWYFDCILDDGTKAVIQFLTTGQKSLVERTPTPNIMVTITDPDGTKHGARPVFTAEEASYAEDRCDVRFGPHRFAGDLQEYTIQFAETDGIAADLHLSSRAKPFRPGSAYFGFGEADEKYYTWLCVVPKGEVTGTLTVNGETRVVHGTGYHDHQWGNQNFWLCWNNWLWARQGFADYSILVFDMIASGTYGYQRFPLCFIQDAEGNVVFENTHELASYEVLEEYTEPKSGKQYPKSSKYTFSNNGTTVSYALKVTDEIEAQDVYSAAPEAARAGFDKAGLQPSYARYGATGDLVIDGTASHVERSGELIYEFMYPGASPYRQHI